MAHLADVRISAADYGVLQTRSAKFFVVREYVLLPRSFRLDKAKTTIIDVDDFAICSLTHVSKISNEC
jgi:hypothetical protein